MAEILKARDLTRPAGPLVAVKRILPHLTEDRQYVTMFLDESRVLAQLEHDNIIRTLEVGQVGQTPFIALEYIFGADARMLFHRARRCEQPTPVAIACYVIAQVCAALHHAHEHTDVDGNLLGLVHRDVSLQNVLISYDGDVKLTDFGIAMSLENVARTEVGIVKGKFGYMSPEQIKGEPMDRRSDVFAAGICLYELLTNERLFSGDTDYAAVEKVRNVVIEPPSRFNREIPSALEAIVMKALARHPRDRFQSAADLRRALLGFMADSNSGCSPSELSKHMRELFADELNEQLAEDARRQEGGARQDPATGLAAFDHLDPVSTVSGSSDYPSVVQPVFDEPPHRRLGQVPSVPPIIPRRDSIPMGRGESDVYPRPELPSAIRAASTGSEIEEPVVVEEGSTSARDWDAHALSSGIEPADGFTGEDDITRQLYVGETLSGLAIGVSGVHSLGSPRFATKAKAASTFDDTELTPAVAAERTREPFALSALPQTSYGAVIGIVLGIIAVIAGVLALTRGGRSAEVHLSTAPIDAEVRVDGELLSATASPFVIRDLTPGSPHQIEVRKSGYRSWSSPLTLASGQILQLPLVTLVPEPGLAAQEPAAPPATRTLDVADEVNGLATPPSVARGQPVIEGELETEAPLGRSHAPAPRHRESRAAVAASGSRRTVAKARDVQALAAGPNGLLRINSRPWSELSIDGKAVGNTPLMNFPLAPGRHSVRLTNPEFGLSKTIHIQITPGQTLTKVVDLQ